MSLFFYNNIFDFYVRICEVQHITKDADQWCPECDEGLCSDCEKYHQTSKASRNHGVISIENYHKLPLLNSVQCC
jgi:hypothetical protein